MKPVAKCASIGANLHTHLAYDAPMKPPLLLVSELGVPSLPALQPR